MAKLEKNLTTGSVWKQLILFAIPLFFSNLIQSIYSVADMMIVSHYSGTAAVSGVNISSNIMVIVINLASGISTGGMVTVGRFLGAGERDNIKRSISTLFITLLSLALVVTFGLLVFANPILDALNTPLEAYAEAYHYLVICAAGIVFIFAYNALSAVMRGMGDGKTPLKFVLVSSIVNIVLDLLFVRGFYWGAGGAAFATVIAQAVSVILCVWYLKKHAFVFDFRLSSFSFHKDMFKMVMKVGLPNGVQLMITNFSFLILSAMVNEMGGVAASAAVGIVGKFNGFAILPEVAISNAVSTMISQNVGADNLKRSKQAVRYGFGLCVVISVVIFLIATCCTKQIFWLFGAETAVVEQGCIYMKAFAFEYVFIPFIIACNAAFLGTGNGWITLIIDVFPAFLVRLPLAVYLGVKLNQGLFGIACSVPSATFVGAVIAVSFYFGGYWKKAFRTKDIKNHNNI
ncbi:MAG: MATE family efflux transporter [Lachnospiraceae bacterium]|nr:MATE family efflux transporter [Lachnospiraceae bacterium]